MGSFQKRYESTLSRGEVRIVPIFVIIKLGLEPLSVGELGLGVPCTPPALEASGKVNCLSVKRSFSRKVLGPQFSLGDLLVPHTARG